MENANIDNFGFVILCPERNYGGLKATADSIKGHFQKVPYICVTTPEADPAELKEFNAVCPTFVGGGTYTSLINLGIRENKADWSYIIMAGMHVRSGQLSRYKTFCHSKKHVMYPIVDRQWQFDESSINGLFINRQAVEEVGYFDETEENFQNVRLLWAGEAINKGYQFRALVGVPR